MSLQVEYPDGLDREAWLKAAHDGRINHPFYKVPRAQAAAWRYMSFETLVEILESRQMFFPSLQTLRQGDRFEGSVTSADIARQARWLQELDKNIISHAPAMPQEQMAEIQQSHRRLHASRFYWEWFENQWTFVCCWHLAERESMAMWQIYGAASKGFAIRTSVRRLNKWLDQFRMPPHGFPFLSKVHYIDRSKDEAMRHYVAATAFCKDDAYQHENEVRLVHRDVPMVPLPDSPNQGAMTFDTSVPFVAGRHFPFEPALLVERIVVAPDTDLWIVDLLRRLLDRLQLSIPVLPSALSGAPLFFPEMTSEGAEYDFS